MTNNFKSKQSSGARPPRLSPEEYAAKKKAEKEAVYQMLDDTAAEVVQSPEKFKGISMCRAEWTDTRRTMYC